MGFGQIPHTSDPHRPCRPNPHKQGGKAATEGQARARRGTEGGEKAGPRPPPPSAGRDILFLGVCPVPHLKVSRNGLASKFGRAQPAPNPRPTPCPTPRPTPHSLSRFGQLGSTRLVFPISSQLLPLFSVRCCAKPSGNSHGELLDQSCLAISPLLRHARSWAILCQKLVLLCHFLLISLAALRFQPPQKQQETSAVLSFSVDVFGCRKQSMDSGVLLKGPGVL